MNPIVIIPARLAAARLPGKPLADIGGVPMIVRVLRRAEAARLGPVVVAAGDRAIVDVVEAAGGRAVLTNPALPSGSDRVQAVVQGLDPRGHHDVVLNLQGDIPFFEPGILAACAGLLADAGTDVSTLVVEEHAAAAKADPDVPKAVLAMAPDGRSGRALYFTRSTLHGEGPVWRHVGLYGFGRAALRSFTTAPPSPLECREGLEQLRALELGLTIRAAVVDARPLEVNNAAELAAARAYAEAHP